MTSTLSRTNSADDLGESARCVPPPSDTRSRQCDPRSSRVRAVAAQSRRPDGCRAKACSGPGTRWSAASPAAARARRAATGAAPPSSVMNSRRPNSNMARPSFCRLASNGRSLRWNVHPQKHEQKNEDRIDNDPHDIRGPTALPLLYSPLAHDGSLSLGPENVSPAHSACNRAHGRSLGKHDSF